MVNLHIQNLCVLLFDAADHITDVIQRFKLHIDVQKRGMFHHHVFHDGEIAHGKEDQHRSQENTFIETGTDGQAHTGGGPEARRGGKALDLPPAGDKDRTGAQKADAVDDLRAEAGDIRPESDLRGNRRPLSSDHDVFVLTEQQCQGRSHTHQHIGPAPGRTALASPLQSQREADDRREQQPQSNRHKIQFTKVIHHSLMKPTGPLAPDNT